MPTLRAFLKVHSQNVSGNKQWLVACAVGWQFFYFFHKLVVFWLVKKWCKDTFFQSPSPFPCNFCKCNNNGVFTASQFYIQLPLLYTVWSNASSEIGPEVTLQPLTTSCAKDYKGHSLMQTSFTEPPSSYSFRIVWWDWECSESAKKQRIVLCSYIKAIQTMLLIDDRLYSTFLRFLEQTHCARIWFCMTMSH